MCEQTVYPFVIPNPQHRTLICMSCSECTRIIACGLLCKPLLGELENRFLSDMSRKRSRWETGTRWHHRRPRDPRAWWKNGRTSAWREAWNTTSRGEVAWAQAAGRLNRLASARRKDWDPRSGHWVRWLDAARRLNGISRAWRQNRNSCPGRHWVRRLDAARRLNRLACAWRQNRNSCPERHWVRRLDATGWLDGLAGAWRQNGHSCAWGYRVWWLDAAGWLNRYACTGRYGVRWLDTARGLNWHSSARWEARSGLSSRTRQSWTFGRAWRRRRCRTAAVVVNRMGELRRQVGCEAALGNAGCRATIGRRLVLWRWSLRRSVRRGTSLRVDSAFTWAGGWWGTARWRATLRVHAALTWAVRWLRGSGRWASLRVHTAFSRTTAWLRAARRRSSLWIWGRSKCRGFVRWNWCLVTRSRSRPGPLPVVDALTGSGENGGEILILKASCKWLGVWQRWRWRADTRFSFLAN